MTEKITLSAPGYESLARVLARAFDQAAAGKGKERHANNLPFDQQPMQTIAAGHGVGFMTGQAAKKSQEALGLPHDRKVAELLGAINYLAGAVIFLEANRKPEPISVNDNKLVADNGMGPYSNTKLLMIASGECKAQDVNGLCERCSPESICINAHRATNNRRNG